MNDTITKEQVLAAYNSAPDFVRAVFNDEKTTQVVIELRARFQLHVDNAGLLGKGVGHMLLGLISPDEFFKDLIEAKIPEKDAREIMTEINQKIFVPLREEMRKSPIAEVKPPQAQSAVATVRKNDEGQTLLNSGTPGLPKLIPSQKPGGTTQSHFHLQNKITAPIQPQPFRGETPKLLPVEEKKLLDDHEEPHIEFKKVPPPPPPNLPGVIHHPPITPPPPSTPPIPPPLPLSPEPKTAVQYSVDPYREPINEK